MTLIKHGGPIQAQNFRAAMPLGTHWRTATCEEIDCPHYLHGWKTVLPADSDLIATLRSSGRSFIEERGEGGLVAFIFAAGQPCFRASQHRTQNDRPALYLHGLRERPSEQRIVGPDEWHERFVETMDGLAGR